jgi:superfamily II RNA helicase
MAPKSHVRPHHRPRGDKPRNSGRRFGTKPKISAIRPGADPKLKKVFERIGVPKKKPFRPDPFQLEAVEAIGASDCLVTVPTGSGKTWIAQKAMERIHASGGSCWYASPLKALSNAKYNEFSHLFGADNVGILTGDRKENPEAPIIIGTTEILRNQLYDVMHRGETFSVDLVVLDEAHFLGDPERGVVWEEVMIYLPSRIPLLMLSATIGNADEIAGWLAAVRGRPCRVIREIRRPVPLYPLFLHPSGTLYPLVMPSPGGRNRLYKKVREFVNTPRQPRLSAPGKLPPFGDILRVLRKYDLLPAVFFLKSRADCDSALNMCEANLLPDTDRRQELSRRMGELAETSSHIAKHRQRWQIENLAVGAHHSGQLPAWKIVTETLMTEGLLDAVFATSTVAAGVNFPARTIVFLNSDRFNGKEFAPLSPTEFHQMTGRAGRRGMDRIGFALGVPGKFLDLPYVARLFDMPASDVDSQIQINFSMVLNLLLSHTPDQVEDLLKLSFARFQKQKSSPRQATDTSDDGRLWRTFLHHLSFLKRLGYVTPEGALTDTGKWAAMLRVDQPILIAEGFRRNLFPQSDPALLAAAIAMFVFDRETGEEVNRQLLPDTLIDTLVRIGEGLHPLAKEMIGEKFPVRPLLIKPAAIVYAWAKEMPWEKVASLGGMEEGDFSMLVLRTADNLRHVRALKKVFPEAAAAAATAIELIMKDPVLPGY